MMKLITAPSTMLEAPVESFDYDNLDPLVISTHMHDLMNKEGGLGLSANQVGLNAQIFVMKCMLNKEHGEKLTVINPVIKGLSKEIEAMPEGCLSIPGLILKVRRPISCMVEFDRLLYTGQDKYEIERIEAKFDDIDARCFLHEYDHLHGIQMTNRVSKLKIAMAEKKRNKKLKGKK